MDAATAVGSSGDPVTSATATKSDQSKPAPAAAASPGAKGAVKPAAKPAAPRTFAEVWQIPVLVLSIVLLVGAVMSVASKRPKPDFTAILQEIQTTIDEQKYEDALDQLNARILPYLDQPAITADNRRLFHTLVARTIYLWQQAATTKRPENYRNVVDEYLQAEREFAKLSPSDSAYLVDSYIALNEINEAVERSKSLREIRPALRFSLVRAMIEKTLASGKPAIAMTVQLLNDLLTEPELPRDLKVWAIAHQTRIMLDAGQADDAIARLLKALPRLAATTTADLGDLYLALGEAYFKNNVVPEATRQFERAAALVEPSSEEMGRAQLMLGKVAELGKETDDAKERYEWIVAHLAGTPVALAAQLGLAEVNASKGETDRSLDLFSELVEQLKRGHAATENETTPEIVGRSLTRLADEAFNAGDATLAQRYALLGELLYGPEACPTPLLKSIGLINLKQAQEAALSANNPELEEGQRSASNSVMKQYYLDAARYLGQHAARLVLESSKDYADSLWSAADCADRGGDHELAMTALQEFRTGFPGDPRQSEASFRLAQAHKARGELSDAAAILSGLIESPDSGRFADDSYVPLAQAYLLDNNPDNDDRAMDLLNTVVGGSLGGPNTDNFRDALIAVGELLYDKGRAALAKSPTGETGGGIDAGDLFAQAITRLDEAQQRFPKVERIDAARFKLADACRLSARVIETKLGEALPDAQRREMEKVRSGRLVRAQEMFDAVRRSIEAKDSKRRSAIEEVFLRNSHLYSADCAFELGDYEGAIRKYDAARDRYAGDPASLVAMVQIVNSYLKLGDVKRAATANEYARRFYASLPDAAWNDPNLPMTRRDWQRWLDATDELTRTREASAETSGAQKN